MKNTSVLIGLGWAIMLLLTGCDPNNKNADRGAVVAECYGNYLFESDLNSLVYPGISKYDSIARVHAFIDSWVRRELLIHQAERNLSPQELDFSKQMQEYRNSLITYAYESQLIRQNLDTVVTDDEITRYYEENKDNFQVRYNMVKVTYVILEEDSKQKKEFNKLLSDRDTLKLQYFDDLARQYSISHYSDVDNWVRLDDLLTKVPIEIFNVESFLQKNHFVSFDKDHLTYMVRFDGYLLEESVSPIELEYDNIRSIILMKRKQELLKQLNNDLYEKAVKDNAFDIY